MTLFVRTVYVGFREYDLYLWYDAIPDDVQRMTHLEDSALAREFVQRATSDFGNEAALNDVLRELSWGGEQAELREDQIQENLVTAFERGWILAVAREGPSVRISSLSDEEPEEESATVAVQEELSLTNPRWEHVDDNRRSESADSVLFGDEIVLRVDVQGAHQGARVDFEVMDQTTDVPTCIGRLAGPNDSGTAEVVWNVEDLAACDDPQAQLRASFLARRRGLESEECDIPYVAERGRLHVVVKSLHMEREWGEQDIVITGGGMEIEGTLDGEGGFEHADEVPFGEYELSIGEFTTRFLAVRRDDPPFVVTVPLEAFPEARWSEEDMEQEGDQFEE